MTAEQNHPITPPPELVEKWACMWEQDEAKRVGNLTFIATQAARWGADTELQACVEWVWKNFNSLDLRAARRPKPPSLKEQALETLKYPKDLWSQAEVNTIRRALEQLPDD